MSATGHIRGHKIYFSEEDKRWHYKDTDNIVTESDIQYCVKCRKPCIDGVDFCLYGLRDCDFINSACCGHGVEQGYIMLKDGRRFVLEQNSGDSDD